LQPKLTFVGKLEQSASIKAGIWGQIWGIIFEMLNLKAAGIHSKNHTFETSFKTFYNNLSSSKNQEHCCEGQNNQKFQPWNKGLIHFG
jgi:hypothetical protein